MNGAPATRRPSRRALLAGGAAALGAAAVAARVLPERAGWTGAPGPGRLVLATGGTKGVYHAYGAALSQQVALAAPGLELAVLETSGSVANLRLLASGGASLAFTAGDAATEAFLGRPPFAAAVPMRALARVYDDYLHLVVPAGSPVRSLADLVGRRVSVGSPGSGTAFMVGRLLAVAGIPAARLRPLELGINESVAELQAGRLDAFFWSGGLPTAWVAELAAAVPVRLVPLADLASPVRGRYGSAYRPATVPAGVYGGRERVATLAVPNLLVCRADSGEAVAERLVATLFGSREALGERVPQVDALDARAAIATYPLPLHAGAERWYRAAKL